MKTQDVIEQLVGTGGTCGCEDIGSYQMEYTSKFPDKVIALDFVTGLCKIFNKDGTKLEQTFAIKATLEPFDP